MRTKEQFLMLWMLGGMMLAGLTACSGSDEEPSKPDDGVKVRRITITETEGAASARQALTRASLTEDDGLTAKWTAGDALTYCNLSRVDYGNGEAPYSGGLTAASTAATSRFTGDVVCSEGDYLAVVYPATTFEYNDRYTISLTGQDGTLGKLASTYHYVYGRAQVTSVTGTTANATMGKMKSLLTVCKFSFKDKSTNAVIPIQTLSISYGGTGSDAGTYPQSATVECGVLRGGFLCRPAAHYWSAHLQLHRHQYERHLYRHSQGHAHRGRVCRGHGTKANRQYSLGVPLVLLCCSFVGRR